MVHNGTATNILKIANFFKRSGTYDNFYFWNVQANVKFATEYKELRSHFLDLESGF